MLVTISSRYFIAEEFEIKKEELMYRRIEIITPTAEGRLSTAFVASHSLVESGLPSPEVPYYRQKRPRYFFTEKGWKQCGHAALGEIRSKGLQARIISLKGKDFRVNVLYKDDLQVLITCRNRCRDR